MRVFFKILIALFVAISWYILSKGEAKGASFAFFFIVLFMLFIKPKAKHSSPIQEQYLQKAQENIKRSQEVNQELMREKSMVYKDLRKRRRND